VSPTDYIKNVYSWESVLKVDKVWQKLHFYHLHKIIMYNLSILIQILNKIVLLHMTPNDNIQLSLWLPFQTGQSGRGLVS